MSGLCDVRLMACREKASKRAAAASCVCVFVGFLVSGI